MRLRGNILASDAKQILLEVGHKVRWLPKSEIRLTPNNYELGPHLVRLDRWLLERAFGTAAPKAAGAELYGHANPD